MFADDLDRLALEQSVYDTVMRRLGDEDSVPSSETACYACGLSPDLCECLSPAVGILGGM